MVEKISAFRNKPLAVAGHTRNHGLFCCFANVLCGLPDPFRTQLGRPGVAFSRSTTCDDDLLEIVQRKLAQDRILPLVTQCPAAQAGLLLPCVPWPAQLCKCR